MATELLDDIDKPGLKRLKLTEEEVAALGTADPSSQEVKDFMETNGLTFGEDVIVDIEGRAAPVIMVTSEYDFGTLSREKVEAASSEVEASPEEDVEVLEDAVLDRTGPPDPSEPIVGDPTDEIEQAALRAQPLVDETTGEDMPANQDEQAAPDATETESKRELDRLIDTLGYRLKSFAEQRGYQQGQEKSRFELFHQRFVVILRQTEYGEISTNEALGSIRMLATELEAEFVAASDPFEGASRDMTRIRFGEELPADKLADRISSATDELGTALRNGAEDGAEMRKQTSQVLDVIRQELIPRMERGINAIDLLHYAAELLMKIGQQSDHDLRRVTRRAEQALREIAELKAKQ